MPTFPPLLATEDTGNIEQAQRKVDVHETILNLVPGETPLRVLSAKLSRRKAINPEYSWLEDEPRPNIVRVNNVAGYTAGDTVILVDDGASGNVRTYFDPGDIIKVFRTGEVLRVASINASTSEITVVRSWGATAAAALVDNDYFMILGTAYAENASKGTPRMVKKAKVTNYTQIIRTPIKISGTLESSALYGGNERAYQRAKAGKEHNWAIERALWWGEKNELISGAPIRSTGGVHEFLTSNVTQLTNDAAFTLAAFDTFLETVFLYGSDHRWVFASPKMMTLINGFAQGKLQVWQQNVGEFRGDKFGVSVARYISPHGRVDLVMTKLFKDYVAPFGSNVLGKVLYALDFDPEDGVAYRYLQGRDTMLKSNIQDPSADGVEDEYLTECGLMLAQQRRMGRLEIGA